MKHRILLVMAVLAAATPIAANSIEAANTTSPGNTSIENTLFMASSGGKTVLGSALSQQGKVFTAEKFNGTEIDTLSDGGQYLDVEIINNSHIAFINKKLTEKGVKASIIIVNRSNSNQSSNFSIQESVKDIELYNSKYYAANSSEIFNAQDSNETFRELNLSEKASITDFEIRGNTTVVATEDADRLVVYRSNERNVFNMSAAEDIQILGLEPLSVLAVHNSVATEYIIEENNLSETWSYSGLEDGSSISRLSNNHTVISSSKQVFAVNSTGSEIWSHDRSSIVDIEHTSDKVHSLRGIAEKKEKVSYWSPDRSTKKKTQEGLLTKIINSISSFLP